MMVPKERVEILTVSVLVCDAATITQAHVEETIGPEMDVAPIVPLLRLRDGEHRPSILEPGHRVLIEGVEGSLLVDEGEIPKRSVGREGDAEEPLVADQNLIGPSTTGTGSPPGGISYTTPPKVVRTKVRPRPVGERHSEFEFGHRQGCHGILGPLLDVHVASIVTPSTRGPWRGPHRSRVPATARSRQASRRPPPIRLRPPALLPGRVGGLGCGVAHPCGEKLTRAGMITSPGGAPRSTPRLEPIGKSPGPSERSVDHQLSGDEDLVGPPNGLTPGVVGAADLQHLHVEEIAGHRRPMKPDRHLRDHDLAGLLAQVVPIRTRDHAQIHTDSRYVRYTA